MISLSKAELQEQANKLKEQLSQSRADINAAFLSNRINFVEYNSCDLNLQKCDTECNNLFSALLTTEFTELVIDESSDAVRLVSATSKLSQAAQSLANVRAFILAVADVVNAVTAIISMISRIAALGI